jgi:hypothetical protein
MYVIEGVISMETLRNVFAKFSRSRLFSALLILPMVALMSATTLADDAPGKRQLARENRAATAEAAPELVPFIVKQVAVECFGECEDSSLARLCEPGWRPIAVDCQNVQEWFGAPCGGDNICARFPVRTSDSLGDHCDDGPGWDANVYCAQ